MADESSKNPQKRADASDMGSLEDELIPSEKDAKRMPRPESGGNKGETADTAGEHGEMAPESAKSLETDES